MIKRYLIAFYDFLKLSVGIIFYLITKKTLPFSYQALIGMFCFTKGRSNDFLSMIVGFLKKPYKFTSSTLLGDMSDENRKQILKRIKTDGYYVFDKKISNELCNRLLTFALTKDCQIRTVDGDSKSVVRVVKYERNEPKAVRYDFRIQDLVDNEDIQNLIADSSFLTVAQDYFGARPVLDIIGMWWNTSFLNKPDKTAAQYYHFDMDRIKWLKFFIYLTDVEANNGPHCFVSGSHNSGALPKSILRKGYARLTDEEVEREFGKKSIVEFTAPKGTVIVEDTRGLHKGKHIQQGDRLILQIQMSNSLFGGYYPKNTFTNILSDSLKSKLKKFPAVYSSYL